MWLWDVLSLDVAKVVKRDEDGFVEATGAAAENQNVLAWVLRWQAALNEHFRGDTAGETVPFAVLGLIMSGQCVENVELLAAIFLDERVNLVLTKDVLLGLVGVDQSEFAAVFGKNSSLNNRNPRSDTRTTRHEKDMLLRLEHGFL